MRQLTFLGHPVHPMIINAPLGLLPFSAVMDCIYLATGDKSYSDAARYALKGGLAGGALAAAAGIADYLTISPGGPMKQTANTHGLLNVAMMALETASLATRVRGRSAPLPAALNVAANLIGAVAAWYGGALVYKHGMRVEPATEKPQPEARLPGDKAMERGLERLRQVVPDGGPGSEE